jgi:hypothetical protein
LITLVAIEPRLDPIACRMEILSDCKAFHGFFDAGLPSPEVSNDGISRISPSGPCLRAVALIISS